MTNGDRRDGDDKGDGKPDGGSNEGDKNDADDSGLRVRKLRPAAVEALIGEMKILDASLGDLFTRVCDAKLGAARQDVAGAVAEIKELATSVGEVVDVEGRVKGVDAMRVKLGALIDASGTVIAFSSRHPRDSADDRDDFDLFVWSSDRLFVQ